MIYKPISGIDKHILHKDGEHILCIPLMAKKKRFNMAYNNIYY